MKTNVIYNEDCLEGMKKLPDNSVDLVLTDPPYGVRKKEEWDDRKNFLTNLENWLLQCYKVTKKGIIWFSTDKMLPEILERTTKNKIEFHRILFWNKPAGSQFAGASHNKIWYSAECILVFKKSDKLLEAGKGSEFDYQSLNHRTVPSKKFNHPTTKPLKLIEKLVSHYSLEDDLILDPFMGTGTTAIACKKLNRDFLGYEKERKHYKTCYYRLGKFDKSYYEQLTDEEKPKQKQLF